MNVYCLTLFIDLQNFQILCHWGTHLYVFAITVDYVVKLCVTCRVQHFENKIIISK